MTRWTPTERAHGTGLAVAIGDKQAAVQTGIPSRTLRAWVAGSRRAKELGPTIETSRAAIVDTLKAATAEGAASLLAILRNPASSDRDKVRAAEVAIDRYQLLTGGPTASNLNVNVDASPYAGLSPSEVQARWTEEREAAAFIRTVHALDGPQQAEYVEGIVAQLRAMNPGGEPHG